MKPHELDALEQMATHTSIREALLVAYHMGVADAFIERTTTDLPPSSLLSMVDRVIGYDDHDAERMPVGWMPEIEDGRG